jgi:hypothetical protein
MKLSAGKVLRESTGGKRGVRRRLTSNSTWQADRYHLFERMESVDDLKLKRRAREFGDAASLRPLTCAPKRQTPLTGGCWSYS